MGDSKCPFLSNKDESIMLEFIERERQFFNDIEEIISLSNLRLLANSDDAGTYAFMINSYYQSLITGYYFEFNSLGDFIEQYDKVINIYLLDTKVLALSLLDLATAFGESDDRSKFIVSKVVNKNFVTRESIFIEQIKNIDIIS